MDLFSKLVYLQERAETLEKENRELVKELKLRKEIELEAVKRYRKVADEWLIYFVNYGSVEKLYPKKNKNMIENDRK